jgi:DNA-binding transcriptional regulator YiaG
MRRCKKCERLMERSTLPEHTEDLGGVVVKVFNAVQVLRCPDCGDEVIAVPDMDGLARATVIARALNPVRVSGREVKFFRRVLDMSQADFATAMDLAPESVSRWENDARGVGGACEKLMRHNVCALLHRQAPGMPYDPAVIAHMKFTSLPEGGTLPPIEMVRVLVQGESPHTDGWAEAA